MEPHTVRLVTRLTLRDTRSESGVVFRRHVEHAGELHALQAWEQRSALRETARTM